MCAGGHYDANAYWNRSKASSSAPDSSSDTSHTHSSHSSISSSSSGRTGQSQALQSAADEANLAAAVAAVAVAAEAALEVDAFDELPYLPADAVADANPVAAPAQLTPSMTAMQAGVENLTSAVKSLLRPSVASSDSNLQEVAVVADSSAEPHVITRQDSGDMAAIAASSQGVSTELVTVKQKSRTEKRPRLIMLPNGLLLPAPLLQSGLPALLDDKQAIADSLKAAPSPAPAKQSRKASETVVKFSDAPLAPNLQAKQAARTVDPLCQDKRAPSADAAAKQSVAGLRRASVTSQGSDNPVVSSPARSKSFSAMSKAGGEGSPEGRLSPGGTPATRRSPFQQAAKSQISQHVERSNASNSVHGSPGETSLNKCHTFTDVCSLIVAQAYSKTCWLICATSCIKMLGTVVRD